LTLVEKNIGLSLLEGLDFNQSFDHTAFYSRKYSKSSTLRKDVCHTSADVNFTFPMSQVAQPSRS
jgi:hypothetical protein